MPDSRIEMLRSVPLFEGVSVRELKQILGIGKHLEFSAGAVIVQEGQSAIDFYVLFGGQARVTVNGRKKGILGPGDYFGEMAVLDGGPRAATVTAETPVSVLRVERNSFLRLLDSHGSIGRKILVQLMRRLRETQRPTKF